LLRRLALAAAAVVLAAIPAAAQGKTTVILVRHAEKALEGGSDPALSEAGQARARALAAELADDSVAAVLVTRFVRTQQTAAPLGIAPRVVPVEGAVEAHAAAVRAAVLAHAGHKVLVVGHSNTVPALVAALGGPAGITIADTEYANLFTVVLEDGKPPVFTRACYGAADPSGPCAAK
ncbi:MAG: hypothetical protein AVDCRST_MAG68-96, partial [uncultured Gemmatimonadetes bacterium]